MNENQKNERKISWNTLKCYIEILKLFQFFKSRKTEGIKLHIAFKKHTQKNVLFFFGWNSAIWEFWIKFRYFTNKMKNKIERKMSTNRKFVMKFNRFNWLPNVFFCYYFGILKFCLIDWYLEDIDSLHFVDSHDAIHVPPWQFQRHSKQCPRTQCHVDLDANDYVFWDWAFEPMENQFVWNDDVV